MSGVILLIGALAIVRQGHQLRHRLRRRHADHRAAGEAGDGRAGPQRARAAGPRRREDPDAQEHGAGQATSSRSRPRSSARTAIDEAENALERRVRHQRPARTRSRSARASARRSPSSALIAIIASLIDHLDLHRAAVRVEVRRAGADRADARRPDRGRRLRPRRPGGDDVDGRGAADHPGLLAVRHDHRVRPRPREHPADAERGVLADRQPLDVRGHHPLAGDQLLHAAAGARRCCCSAATR